MDTRRAQEEEDKTACLEKAMELLRQRRFDEAFAHLDQLVESPQHRYQALGYRAFHYKAFGRYDEALADYAAMQQIAPDDAMVNCYVGEIYNRQGRYREAVAQALQALALNPNLFEATRVIANAQEAQGIGDKSYPGFGAGTAAAVKPLNPAIERLETQPAGFPGSVFPEVGRILYTLVRMTRPSLVVETGTFVGYSALHIAQALQDNNMGHLHCFDLFSEIPGYVSPLAGAVRDSFEMVSMHMHAAGLDSRTTLHRGDSSQQIRAFFAQRPGTVQMAFIDGDHRIHGALEDWLAVDEILAPGGLVVLHDTEPHKCGWLGPRYLVEKLKEKLPAHYGVVNLPTAEGYGVALLEKHADAAGQPIDWWPSLAELVAEHFHLVKYKHCFQRLRFLDFGRLMRQWLRGSRFARQSKPGPSDRE